MFNQKDFGIFYQFDENVLFVIVAIQQQVMQLRIDRGTGMLQVVGQKIICGNIQGIGDHDQHFQTWTFCSSFDSADVLVIHKDDLPEGILRELLICPVLLYAPAYAFIVYGHFYLPFLNGPH